MLKSPESFLEPGTLAQSERRGEGVGTVWDPQGAVMKHHKPGGLKQPKRTASQFWRREV